MLGPTVQCWGNPVKEKVPLQGGEYVGCPEGCPEGWPVGLLLGCALGSPVGWTLG